MRGHRLTPTLLLTVLLTTPMASRAATNHADPWITTKLKIALLTTSGVSVRDVSVDTTNGRVTLYGTVGSASERKKAEQVAHSVAGVTEVRDLLQVVAPKAQNRVAAGDADLTARVREALRSDAELGKSNVDVKSVNNGVVLLGGDVSSLNTHLHAIEVANGVDGVRRVASEIHSPDKLGDDEIWRDAGRAPSTAAAKNTARDLWITTAAKTRLLVSAPGQAFDINVDTRGGVVTLFGVVDSETGKQAAQDQVAKVDGATRVENHLQVVAPGKRDAVTAKDDAIETAVEKRLSANASLAGDKLDAAVSAGVVRLTGTVNDPVERLTALTLARTTPGVRGVVDGIEVSTKQ